jgi:hypothetical protein
MVFHRLSRTAVMTLVLCCVLFTACGENGVGTRATNTPPTAFIASGPAGDTPTHFQARVFWYGTDPDGYVDEFLVKTIKGARQADFTPDTDWDSIPGWSRTGASESTFVLLADSCCTGSGDAVSALSPWGVLVRAVDNEGAVSPEPAAIFFQATNVIPRVKITSPRKLPTPYKSVPPHPFVAWEGVDPDGNNDRLRYKYIVLPEAQLNPNYPRLPPLERVRPNEPPESHAAAPFGYWSEWVPADCTYVWDLDLTPYKGTGERIVIYVTAKDEADAYLPEKLYGSYNGGLNWIRLIVVSTGTGVSCVVDGGPLGVRSSDDFTDNQHTWAVTFLGTEVSFQFWGRESQWRGEIADAYKYYWDTPLSPSSSWDFWTSTRPIRDVSAAPHWSVKYPRDGNSLTPSLGKHVFVVRLKDRNSIETECQFGIEVIEGPQAAPEQKILLVDDNEGHWPEQRWAGFGEAQDDLWADILDGYNWEEFDTGPNYGRRVPVRFVGDATTVIWLVDQDDTTIPVTTLLDCCTALGNYLFSYVRAGGNLIVMGRNPVYACGYWPDGHPEPQRRGWYTSWTFHPDSRSSSRDTTNFLWEVFGIERMKVSRLPHTAVIPCGECYSAMNDTIELGPQAVHIYDIIENACYVTRLRSDMDVRPLFRTAKRDRHGEWIDSRRGEDLNYIAAYVPGNQRRGHAAYIGFPEFWFDHAKIKAMVRELLTEFEEQTGTDG